MEYEIRYNGVKARWVTGYEGIYRITESGEVVSYATSNIKTITGKVTSKGYIHVNLTKDGIIRTFRVHRLVAEAFIENPEEKCSVDHKDENKLNNSVGNLRWCTIPENNKFYKDNHPTVPKEVERVYGTVEDMVKATGKSIIVSGQEFPSCGSAAQYIVDQEVLEERTRNKATVSKELRRFLQRKKPAWTMYERYTIGT